MLEANKRKFGGVLHGCLLVLPLLGLCTTAGYAQDAPAVLTGTNTRTTPSGQNLPVTLADLMRQAPWEASRRGPLLIVDAAHVLRDKTLPLPPPDRSGYVLRDDDSRFARAI